MSILYTLSGILGENVSIEMGDRSAIPIGFFTVSWTFADWLFEGKF